MSIGLCPGSRQIPAALTEAGARPRGVCPCCDREYSLAAPGVIRGHRGLPLPAGGGCPYRCPETCDFDCYFPDRSEEEALR